MTALTLNDLTHEERRILSLILAEPGAFVNLPALSDRRFKDKEIKTTTTPEAVYRRVYRAIQRLEYRGLIDVSKEDDGLTWARARPPAVVDLIRAYAKFQLSENETEPAPDREATLTEIDVKIKRQSLKIQPDQPPEPYKPPKRTVYDTPRNATGARLNAIKHLKAVKMLDEGDDYDIRSMFAAYLQKIDDKIITMENTQTGEIVGMEYSTRFNDQRKTLINLDKYDYAMDKSAQDHYKAVFLTLTTDPKLFPNNWTANRHMAGAWNKFLSFLTKRLKRRPKFIASYEFTKTGLLHVHAIIYVNYLIPKDDITKEWEKVGQGTVNYIYRLNSRGGKWTWAGDKERPKDAKTGNAGDYLKKYLKKCLFATREGAAAADSPLYMYWAMNKRFWTASRSLLPITEKRPPSPAIYRYAGILDTDTAFTMVERLLYQRLNPPENWPPPKVII